MSAGGYRVGVDGPVYQAGEDGLLRRIDGADLDPGRPFYFIPDEADHDQGDDPVELGPEWVQLGYTSP